MSPARLRARAHPRAILAVWGWQLAVALLAGVPFAMVVRAGLGSDPRGDAPLWDPGGRALLEVVLHDATGASSAGYAALLVVLAATVTGWLPLGALMASLARPAHRAVRPLVVEVTLRLAPRMASCGALVLASQATVLGGGLFLGGLAEGWTHQALGEARSQVLGVAVGAPFGVVALALGVAHDVARARIVVGRTGALAALLGGFASFRAAPLRLGWAWAWRTALSLVPIAAAGAVADRLGGRGGSALVAVALAHQGAALTRVALRASWLAWALREVSQPPERDR